MTSILTSLLPFAIILVLLVVWHEAGHFITAKLSGVKVLEFGIGYPPRLFGIKRGETEYTINALPLGGFVRLLGEEDPTDPQSLAAQPAWKRLIVMGAGSFMNFILAVALFSIALMIPREVPVGQAVITQVMPDSPAAQAGLKSGDILLSIGGRTITNVGDASDDIRLHLGEKVGVSVRRTDPTTQQSSVETFQVQPRWAPPDYLYDVAPGATVDSVAQATGFDRDYVRQAAGIKTTLPTGKVLEIQNGSDTVEYTVQEGDTVAIVGRALRLPDAAIATAAGLPDQETLTAGSTLHFKEGPTGISLAAQYPFTESRSLPPLTALHRGWQSTFDALKLMRNSVITWVRGGAGAPVSGPIGIAQATGEVYREAGWKVLVDWMAALSINLAVLNILPLPMLDGGRMFFVVVEVLRRGRRIAPAKEAMVHLVGMTAILILVVVLSYFDVARIVRGDTLFR